MRAGETVIPQLYGQWAEGGVWDRDWSVSVEMGQRGLLDLQNSPEMHLSFALVVVFGRLQPGSPLI